MNIERKDELIIHLMVNVSTELQTLREFLLGEILPRVGMEEEEIQEMAISYGNTLEEKKKEIITQIRLSYGNDLGDVDGLLKSIFPK